MSLVPPSGTPQDAPPQTPPPASARFRPRLASIGLGLAILCLLLRVIKLMALPIFGDESIYLAWAQIIRGEGLSPLFSGMHPWVSLIDPKPPLHFWLIAIFYHFTADPLLAARLISVAAGVAAVPLMLALGTEFGLLMKPRPRQITGRGLGIAATLLAIFCPFLAFYQRMATADALFVTESLLTLWLSLRWARLAFETCRRASWLTALGLGISLGIGYLTRQGISYTICAMPVVAWLVRLSTHMDARAAQPAETREKNFPRRAGRGMAQLSAAALISLVLWVPYLTAQLTARTQDVAREHPTVSTTQPTAGEYRNELKRRITYQSSFTESSDRLAILKRNLSVTFLPGWNQNGEVNSGWLMAYMTPLVLVVCLAGLIYTCIRQGRVAIILLVWLLVLLGPVLYLLETIYSRYVLAGVPPLLFAGAYFLGDTTLLLSKKSAGRVMALVLWALVLALPALELYRQAFDWKHQTLTEWLPAGPMRVKADRYQYLTGWTGGQPSMDAVAFLRDRARAHPERTLFVITNRGWGLPADAMGVYLSSEKNIRICQIDVADRVGPILRPGRDPGTFSLRTDKWFFTPEHDVPIASADEVCLVVNDPEHKAFGDISAEVFFQRDNPNLKLVHTSYGIDGPNSEENIRVFLVPHR